MNYRSSTSGLMLVCVALLTLAASASSSGTATLTPAAVAIGAFASTTELTAVPAATSALSPQHSIVFTGDLFLGRRVETMMRSHGTSSFPFMHLHPFPSSTAMVSNFEAAIPNTHQHTPDLTFQFSVDPDLLGGARQFGITHVGLANNHSYDYDMTGYHQTVAALRSHDFVPFGDQHIGTSSVSVVALNDVTVALVAVYAVDVGPSTQALADLLATPVVASTTYQVAYVHWGAEYEPNHSTTQEKLARELVLLGIDAVVGHHPHVVQDVALYDGVPVFYSLGNFVFDQYFSDAVQTGLVLELWPSTEKLRFDLVPIASLEHRSQPNRLIGLERTAFLLELARRSDPALTDGVLTGTIAVPGRRLQNH